MGIIKKKMLKGAKQIQAQHHLEINGIVDEQVWNLSFGKGIMYIMPDYMRTALIRAGRTFAQTLNQQC